MYPEGALPPQNAGLGNCGTDLSGSDSDLSCFLKFTLEQAEEIGF